MGSPPISSEISSNDQQGDVDRSIDNLEKVAKFYLVSVRKLLEAVENTLISAQNLSERISLPHRREICLKMWDMKASCIELTTLPGSPDAIDANQNLVYLPAFIDYGQRDRCNWEAQTQKFRSAFQRLRTCVGQHVSVETGRQEPILEAMTTLESTYKEWETSLNDWTSTQLLFIGAAREGITVASSYASMPSGEQTTQPTNLTGSIPPSTQPTGHNVDDGELQGVGSRKAVPSSGSTVSRGA